MTPNYERARRLGELFGDPRTQTFAQLLIDLKDSPHARPVAEAEDAYASLAVPIFSSPKSRL